MLLGLFGEVGSLLSELKKKQRDKNSYAAFEQSAVEELGDVLWYFSSISRRFKTSLSTVANFESVSSTNALPAGTMWIRTFTDLQPQGRLFRGPVTGQKVETRLLWLAGRVGDLAEFESTRPFEERSVVAMLGPVFRALVDAADDAEISLERAARYNLWKTENRWPTERIWGDLYDTDKDEEERFPDNLAITFKEKQTNEKVFVLQKCNGVIIGDRLTDNRKAQDDYRFHDVFHISYAAILGWSPVLRALLKLKRKSDSEIDEQQDGARAMLAEEGISNWIFSQGLRHQLFKDVDSIEFSILKTIRDMVHGYEVETRPLWMWEHAILEGFRVFRELKTHRGGIVLADFLKRTIDYRAPTHDQQQE